jgi:hypothetical protein
MVEKDTAIDPKPIISFMFAISVGFWASQLVQYVTPTLTARNFKGEIANQLSKCVDVTFHVKKPPVDVKKPTVDVKKPTVDVKKPTVDDLQSYVGDLKSYIEKMLEEDIQSKDWGYSIFVGKLKEKLTEDTTYLENLFKAASDKEHADPPVKSTVFIKEGLRKKAKEVLQNYAPHPVGLRWWLTLISGLLFLIDLLCIVWWYARYIYRVQPKVSFGTYFLDFLVCSMFALAANSWTRSATFVCATLFGTTFLLLRFALLYFSSSASETDRYILKRSGLALVLVLPITLSCLYALATALSKDGNTNVFLSALPGLLSLIGVLLTACLKTKIEVAVAIYSARHAPVSSAHLIWPKSMSSDSENVEEQHMRIRRRTEEGLAKFDNLFEQFGKHDRIRSRVHSETQLRTQSYILSLPSCENEVYSDEIQKKAFMVAVSHWLDDLVDGRNEIDVHKKLQCDIPLSDRQEEAEELFKQIYKPLIVKYTNRKFYYELVAMINQSARLPFNRKYIFLSLNRVAYGSVIFSPKITHRRRLRMLDKHNDFLKKWNVEKDTFTYEVEDILDQIATGDDAGPILLGLTTKTVQEMALSSEKNELNIGLSILLSILYAPLIYYHNIPQELENAEMVPLQAFETDCDQWICWLKRVRDAIYKTWDSSIVGDTERGRQERKRKEARIKQIEMAYRCFLPNLPKFLRPELNKIYLQGPEGVSSTEKIVN